MNVLDWRYSSRKFFLSSWVTSEKSRCRRLAFAIYVLYVYVQYLDIGRTQSPYLFFTIILYTKFGRKSNFHFCLFDFLISWYFVRFEKIISWYFVSRPALPRHLTSDFFSKHTPVRHLTSDKKIFLIFFKNLLTNAFVCDIIKEQ